MCLGVRWFEKAGRNVVNLDCLRKADAREEEGYFDKIKRGTEGRAQDRSQTLSAIPFIIAHLILSFHRHDPRVDLCRHSCAVQTPESPSNLRLGAAHNRNYAELLILSACQLQFQALRSLQSMAWAIIFDLLTAKCLFVLRSGYSGTLVLLVYERVSLVVPQEMALFRISSCQYRCWLLRTLRPSPPKPLCTSNLHGVHGLIFELFLAALKDLCRLAFVRNILTARIERFVLAGNFVLLHTRLTLHVLSRCCPGKQRKLQDIATSNYLHNQTTLPRAMKKIL